MLPKPPRPIDPPEPIPTDHPLMFPRDATLRDWFAGQALVGLLMSGCFADLAPRRAYRIADDVMEERNPETE